MSEIEKKLFIELTDNAFKQKQCLTEINELRTAIRCKRLVMKDLRISGNATMKQFKSLIETQDENEPLSYEVDRTRGVLSEKDVDIRTRIAQDIQKGLKDVNLRGADVAVHITMPQK